MVSWLSVLQAVSLFCALPTASAASWKQSQSSFVTIKTATMRQAAATLNQTGSGMELLRVPLLQTGDSIMQVRMQTLRGSDTLEQRHIVVVLQPLRCQQSLPRAHVRAGRDFKFGRGTRCTSCVGRAGLPCTAKALRCAIGVQLVLHVIQVTAAGAKCGVPGSALRHTRTSPRVQR